MNNCLILNIKDKLLLDMQCYILKMMNKMYDNEHFVYYTRTMTD